MSVEMDCDPDKVIKAFDDWLRIRENEGLIFPDNAVQFYADIAHSSLLRRLLKDDKIFDNPPPRAFAYHWYDLLENEKGKPFEVHYNDMFFKFPALIIDQSVWKIIEHISNDEYICVYSMGRDKKARWSETKWRVKRMPDAIKHPRNWEITKV